MVKAPACTFVIFGVSGDLAARKLIPALFELHREGAMHEDTQIVGYARRDWDDDELRTRMRDALIKYGHGDFDQALWDDLAPRLSFCQGNYEGGEGYHALANHLKSLSHETHLFYTATPPSTYESIANGLGQAGLNQSDARFIIEKPFGTDLESAKALNATILKNFDEEQVYRIDHYLAKETAQNIAALRFANTIFEPTWNSQYVDHVQVTMAEPMGIEGRGSFYEQAGVVRDVVQNHLLQLAALVATEPPASYDAKSVRDEKVKVLRAMHCVQVGDAVMGQYVSGSAHSSHQNSYRDEEGVDSRSRQATYAAIELRIDNWRWAGVPFYIRSGKRLVSKSSEIVIYYKTPPHVPFQFRKPPREDRIVLRLVPNEGISIRYNAKVPGQGISLNTASMDFYYNEQFKRRNPDAYETLLLDAMMGDATLFMRADEVEEQWRIVMPILNTWENANDEPAFYESGSWGPEEADDMLARSGRRWHAPQTESR
ncbi:MAG: glucose-6-phosphate dehydrogenase [Deinococcota bacterium]